jgi:hypothetical protein
MATITKRATSRGVTYRAAIRRTGFPKTIKTFSTKKQAQAWARKVEADLESLKAGTAAAERVTEDSHFKRPFGVEGEVSNGHR